MELKSMMAGQLKAMVLVIERLTEDALRIADSDDDLWKVAEHLREAAQHVQHAAREARELGRE